MEPLIYKLPISSKLIKFDDLKICYDNNPSPKMIKYGFNHINDDLDMIKLTSDVHYKAGLEFDLDNINNKIIQDSTPEYKLINLKSGFMELWEIIMLFDLFNKNQSIYTNDTKTMNNIINTYKTLFQTNYEYNVTNKIANKMTLVIFRFSDIDISEDSIVHFIITNVNNLMSVQNKGSDMILQLFGMQTQITTELIYYLSSLYNGAYIIKPMIISELYDCKYIFLTDLKQEIMVSFPKELDRNYIFSLGLSNDASIYKTENIIQCINSYCIPKKYLRYHYIKKYLDIKVFEGSRYQEMVNDQEKNLKEWLITYTNLKKCSLLLNKVLDKTNEDCSIYNQINEMIF